MIDDVAADYLIETCLLAGAEILDVYASDFDVAKKADSSPVTAADLRANHVITERLRARWPDVPVLSEESAKAAHEVRRHWQRFWLVDPLDGTKEFIKRNGQFTVNIALIEDGRPAAGWVWAPASKTLYWGIVGHGAWKREGDGAPQSLPIDGRQSPDTYRIVGSLSHPSPQLAAFLAKAKLRYKHVEFVPMGSSLKICLVAEGAADTYPRYGPTMEWDTAAAHAVANAAGRRVVRHGSTAELEYNKPDLHNPWFLVS